MISSNVPTVAKGLIATELGDLRSSSSLAPIPGPVVNDVATELESSQQEMDDAASARLERTEKTDRSTARLIAMISNRGQMPPQSHTTVNVSDSPRGDEQRVSQSPNDSRSIFFRQSEFHVRRLVSNFDQDTAIGGNTAQAQRNNPELMSVISCQEPVSEPPTSSRQSTDSLLKYYSEQNGSPVMQRTEIEEMVRHSAIANSLYYDFEPELLKAERILTNDPTIVCTAWQRFELPAELQAALGLEEFEDGRLFHGQSDIVAILLKNDELKTVTVAFGGTTAGKNKGPLLYRLLTNPISTFKHWRRNLQSIGFPFTSKLPPDSYFKAVDIAKSVDSTIKNNPDKYPGYSISATGHSKGAAEAEFVTLMHPAIRSMCFSTPPLGKRVLQQVPRENFEIAKDNIQHYFVEHDLIPSINVTLTRFLSTGHIGKGQWLPAPTHIITGPLYMLWAHDSFNHCVGDFAAKSALPFITNAENGDTCITVNDLPDANPEHTSLLLLEAPNAQPDVLRNDERV